MKNIIQRMNTYRSSATFVLRYFKTSTYMLISYHQTLHVVILLFFRSLLKTIYFWIQNEQCRYIHIQILVLYKYKAKCTLTHTLTNFFYFVCAFSRVNNFSLLILVCFEPLTLKSFDVIKQTQRQRQ